MDDNELQQLMSQFERRTQTAWQQLQFGQLPPPGTAESQRRLRYAQVLQRIAFELPQLGAAYGEAGRAGLLSELPKPARLAVSPPEGDLNTFMLDLQHDWVDVLHPLEVLGKWPPAMHSIGPWPPRTSKAPGSEEPGGKGNSDFFDGLPHAAGGGKGPPDPM